VKNFEDIQFEGEMPDFSGNSTGFGLGTDALIR
jgi:hypothetical protein